MREMISKILGSYNLIAPVLGFIFVTVLISGIWYEGKYRGAQEQKVIVAQEKAKSMAKGIQAHAKEERKSNSLSDADLDAALDKWMRD